MNETRPSGGIQYLLIAALIIAIARWIADALTALEPRSTTTWLSADTFLVVVVGIALVQMNRASAGESLPAARRNLRIAVAGLILGIAVAVATVGIAAWRGISF